MLVYVLGTAQDSGYPQANCYEKCCQEAWINDSLKRFPSSIAIIDQEKKKYWLIDVTPSLKEQLDLIKSFNCSLEGIFITHAHIGHYMGLINFGLEVMNLKEVPVYVMPRMMQFLKQNSIFQQLLFNNNINLEKMKNNTLISIQDNFSIFPFEVPHRNELSETVGFSIKGKQDSIVYLPDIDSWHEWEDKLFNLIKTHDKLFIDGTFFSKQEISHRDISKIPHPEITSTGCMMS